VWKCSGGECWEEIITHTEYWIKRSVSTDQHHWSTPQNVIQIKSTTGNPVVIENQDGTFIMYYKDTYVWTEENCYWEGRCPDCQYICDTITHTEYWIYRRTSTDGLIWQSPVKIQKTTFGVKNIAAIQKQDSTYLMCYTDKVGTMYYIRQKTSSNGLTWSSPSNIIQVNSGTGNPALLQRDSGTVYLAYKKGDNYIYVLSNSGSGWSSPVQTTGTTEGDPALLETDPDIVIIFKGTDGHCSRISSSDGVTWSSPSQIAPNKIISDPATVTRKDRFYRVTTRYISASTADLVKVLEFSYEGEYYLPHSCNVLIRDAQTLQSSIHLEYDSKGRVVERISKDEQGVQTEKIVYTYNNRNKVIRQDVYSGASTDISYSMIMGYDNKGNVIYTKNPEGAEHFYSYANTNCENQFVDSKGLPVDLFSNTFYTNSVPSNCHNLLVGEALINNGKVQETYCKYDANGNLTEIKTLFPTRSYEVFSGIFDERSQTTFEFDLTGLTITNGILVISSIAVPTQETLHETHSEPGKGWLNSGSWSGKYFLAEYLRCTPEPDCFAGEIKIGPFEHYPGSPNYTGYTTWVEDNTQYVQTSYSAIVNEYPEQTEYKLNNGSWTTITSNLGSGTTSTIIPASSFVQGLNTLQFQETNTYTTKFAWTLYIDQGATPEEYINTCAYDTYGNLTSFTDAMNNTTFFGYDSHYLYLTSVTNALNQTITATHDFNTGLLTSITDPKGNITFYEYDILGRVTRKIHPDLSELEAVYNDANNYVTIYDELDHYITRYFDGLSRLTRVEMYLSPTVILTETYSYNYLNKIKTKEDPEGHIYSFEYDSIGRSKKLINPDSTYREICHNDVTNTVSVIDENQHKKEYHYDWVGNLLWVKEYTDSVNYSLTQYTYDSAGQLTSFTDANGYTTHYSYDLFGVSHITYPDSTTETYSYDAVGNLLQKTDGNGVTTFMYDALYQLTEVEYPDQSLTFEYDSNGNRTFMVDSAGQTSCTYDNRNRLLSQTRTIEGEPYTVAYGYDAASRLISLTYPDQAVVTLEYDSQNRLINIPGYAQFTYTADSLFESMTYTNGVTTTYQYDACHRPVAIHAQKHTDLLLMEYQYDPVGNITQMNYNRQSSDEQWVESSETYQYDWLDRLVGAQGDYGWVTYSYDALGNRILKNDSVYTYNDMNELLSISNGTVFTYDQNGNTVTKNGIDTFSYTYDRKNQLIRVEKNHKMQEEYVYNGDGCRIKKTEWVESLQEYQTVAYVYSGANIIYEKNLDTGSYAVYVYGPNGRIAKKVGGLTDYYLVDHLGSTRLITDESGNIITDVTYMPFGESAVNGVEDHYLYNGKERDSTGLYYYGARYYDPETGRFLTRDHLKGNCIEPQSLNLYSYCLNNPLRYTDPLGFQVDDEILDTIRKIFSSLLGVDLEILGQDLGAYLDKYKEEGILAALESLVEDLGFDASIQYDEGLGMDVLVISVNIDGIDCREVKLYVDEEEGKAGGYEEKTKSFYISINQHRTVAELLTTILHEICHHVLKKEASELSTKQEHFYIYYVEWEYMNKLIEMQKGMGENSPYYPYSNIYYSGMGEHFLENVFMPIYLFYFLGKRTSIFKE
jgi:RHS repeat-associated protein